MAGIFNNYFKSKLTAIAILMSFLAGQVQTEPLNSVYQYTIVAYQWERMTKPLF